MFRLLLISSIFLFSIQCIAQASFVSMGGNGSSSNISLSFTLGQLSDNNDSNGSILINEGVQQPSETYTINIKEDEIDYLKDLAVYPNPFFSEFTIKSKNKLKSIGLYNSTMAKIKKINVFNVETTIETSDLPTGLYYLLLTDLNSKQQVIKLIKSK